jgi:hypothetical protein
MARAALCGGAAALVACGALGVQLGCVEPDSGGHYRHGASEPIDVAGAQIDSGGQVELDPGMGVGVGVEYAGGGAWQIATACDTALSDAVCHFDVVLSELQSASAADGITAAAGVALEAEDQLSQPDPFSLELDFVTGSDLDGATFSTTPGATVRVAALLYDPIYDSALDWVADPRFIYWVGAGALQTGAPTDPVDLTPDQP